MLRCYAFGRFLSIFAPMKRFFWLFLLVGCTLTAAAADSLSVEALLTSLDEAIRAHEDYVALREARIARLREPVAAASEASRNRELYREYKAYNCDSAIHYLRLNLQQAVEEGDRHTVDDTRLELAYLLASAGMYKEAADVLAEVDRSVPDTALLPRYYNTSRHLYAEMSGFTQDAVLRQEYHRQAVCYDDSLMQQLPLGAPLYLERREMREAMAGNVEEALSINDMRLAGLTSGNPEYALVTYHRSQHYRRMGLREEEKRYLALSALTDVRLAITDHASLWNLAQVLYEEGDIERAYLYIRFSWDETGRYNARSRSLQTAGILSLIDLTYQAMSERQNDHLRLYIGLISALSLLLVAAIFFIYRQMKRLSAAHKHLEEANEQLHISNHIKEEYIGRFMNLCSLYINRLDSYRRMVNKKVTAGQTEELLKMVRSRELMDVGLKELYEHFDTAFLHLFPDFIEKFNELLLPEERIVLRKGELLNTELRIFALIRLGIDDSSQIAEFLRYSVNTIYNYRARVKSKARVSRDEFETLLMKIR